MQTKEKLKVQTPHRTPVDAGQWKQTLDAVGNKGPRHAPCEPELGHVHCKRRSSIPKRIEDRGQNVFKEVGANPMDSAWTQTTRKGPTVFVQIIDREKKGRTSRKTPKRSNISTVDNLYEYGSCDVLKRSSVVFMQRNEVDRANASADEGTEQAHPTHPRTMPA